MKNKYKHIYNYITIKRQQNSTFNDSNLPMSQNFTLEWLRLVYKSISSKIQCAHACIYLSDTSRHYNTGVVDSTQRPSHNNVW